MVGIKFRNFTSVYNMGILGPLTHIIIVASHIEIRVRYACVPDFPYIRRRRPDQVLKISIGWVHIRIWVEVVLCLVGNGTGGVKEEVACLGRLTINSKVVTQKVRFHKPWSDQIPAPK